MPLWTRRSGNKAEAITLIEEGLASLPWLGDARGQIFYAVGGTWRALAKVHMRQTAYPLTAVHGYRLDGRKALQITARYANSAPSTLARLDGMPLGREETLPLGALLLNAIVRKMQPDEVVFSAFGVREGTIYRLLSEAQRAEDPLLSACEDVASRRARSPQHAKELEGWTDALFPEPAETAEERRLRHAACLLSDLSWRAHPDYRGEQSAVLIAQSSFVGVDHPGRAFLALCVYHRYERKLTGELLPKLAAMLPRQHKEARAGDRAGRPARPHAVGRAEGRAAANLARL